MLDGHPTVTAHRRERFGAALRLEGPDDQDALMARREHGMDDVADVHLAVPETHGSFSVAPGGGGVLRSRRTRCRTHT